MLSSTPRLIGAFDFGGWLVDNIYNSMLSLFSTVMSLVVSSTDPDLGGEEFSRQLANSREIAIYLMVPLALCAIIMSIFKGQLKDTLITIGVAVPAVIIAMPASIWLLQIVQIIDDNITDFIIGATYADAMTFLEELRDNGADGSLAVGAFAAAIAGIVVIVCLAALWIEFVIREALIYMTVMFLPIVLAVAVWAPLRQWLVTMTEVILALIFAKFVTVGTFCFGMAIAARLTEDAGSNSGNLSTVQGLETLIIAAGVVITAAFSMPALLAFVLGASRGTQVAAQASGRDVLRQSPLSQSTGKAALRDGVVGGVRKAVTRGK